MLGQYLPLFFLILVAAAFAAGSFLASGLFAPRNPTLAKQAPYECGIVPTRETPERFPVRFFLVAMIFIVFDIEIIFFYPWAVAQGGLGIFGLVLIMVFSFAVFESFIYLIGNGALEWGPLKQQAPPAEMVSPERTMQTTIRRVGLEDRSPADAVDDGEAA
ncbi:MAG: NADH-quinone oxidoreductase subunit A [Actinomycetota bacterium]